MKKSQIQMGENVIILFIFFILLIFSVVFYTRLQSTKVQQKIDIDVTGRGLQIAQKVSFLPEVQCTKDNTEIFSGCYDEYSLRALNELTKKGENKEYYFDVFGYSRITVNKVFPSQDEEVLTMYENIKPDYVSLITTNMPITLCNFISEEESRGTCSFAVLKVEVFN